MKRAFCFAGLLLLSFVCFAQDEEWEDTVVTTENVMEERVTVYEKTGASERTEVQFNEVGAAEQVELKKLPVGKVEQLKKEEDYWYADWEPQKPKPKEQKEPPPQAQPVNIGWLRPLFWIIIIAILVGGIIWFLAHNDIRLFARPSKKISADEDDEEELSDDIFAINYEKEIRRAEGAGNYRLAVRLWYLQTLRELSDRGLIDYRYGKTNSDYVSALYGGKYYRPFFSLTRTFDYTWYGQFALSSENYTQVAADFMAFKNSLGA